MSPALTLFLGVVIATATVAVLHVRARRRLAVTLSTPSPSTGPTHRAPYDANGEHWTEVPWHTPTHRGRAVMHTAGDRSRCDSAVIVADDTARLRVCLDHDRRV